MALWFADTHVHFYPQYDAVKFFDAARKNLFGEIKVLYLTERANEDFFQRLQTMSIKGYEIVLRENVLEVSHLATCEKVYVIKGFQIISKGKIEILSLASSERCPNGLEDEETIENIISDGGLPVLPWSPGKWCGERGKRVKKLISDRGVKTGEILNSSLHVYPKYMNPLFGSDPLPLNNEERFIGKLGVCGEWDREVSFSSARSFLDQNLKRYGSFLLPHRAFLRTLSVNLKR